MQNLERPIRARVRARVRRAMAAAEEEQQEGGELNLVPFLDILVNTIIFLLATTVSMVPLASVHANAPRYVPPREANHAPAATGKEGLRLTVAITGRGFIVGGAGGVLRDERGRLPTIPCRDGRQDFDGLTRLARTIKQQHPQARRVYLVADAQVPYRTVVRTMDALRGGRTKTDRLFDRVVFATGVR